MRSLSKTFDSMGSKLMGLYDCTSSGGFPGLGIGIICDTFHWFG